MYFPQLQKDGTLISLISLADNDASKFDVSAIVRNLAVICDMNQAAAVHSIIHTEEITLIDCNGISLLKVI